MDPIPLPAPYLGVDDQIPIISMESPNCENLLNFNVTQNGVILRNGDSKFDTFTRSGTSDPLGLFPYGDTKLFAAVYRAAGAGIDLTDAETGTVEFTTGNQLSITAVNTAFFNNYLFFFFNTSTFAPGYAWDGAAIGATTYTAASGYTNLWPVGGNPFNNRMYMIQLNEPAYWYGGIEKITGDCVKVDLSTIVQQKCTLSIIASFTLSAQTTTQRVQTFIFSNGEVLFYTGTYPNSFDWTNIGAAKIGQPLFIQSIIPYQGDTLVMCDSGVVSLRDLFLQGSQDALGLSVNSKIQRKWQALVKDMRRVLSTPTGPITGGLLVGNIRGVYDPSSDRIIISFPYYLNSSDVATVGSFYFVFDCSLQAWFYHRSYGAGPSGTVYDLCMYKNKPLLLGKDSSSTTYMIWQKEGATGFTDRNNLDSGEIAYDYEIISAPVSNGRAYVQKGEGMDIILESDLYDETNYYLVRDLGVETTSAQKVPSQPTGIQKPFVNMGIEGSFIQYKISGTTAASKTVGYEFYGSNFWIEMGDAPR